MLGYTQWNVPEVLYLASFTGVYGLSFILAFTGACVGWGFAVPGVRQGFWQFILGTLVFASVFGFGKYQTDRRLAWEERRQVQSLLNVQASLLQPNIDQYKKWTPQFEQEIRQTLQQMGDSLAGKGVYLAVWPESVVPDSLTEENSFNLFADIAQKSEAYQILGSNVFENNQQYVGAYLMAPQTAELSVYRKIKLVPFGEFIPLEPLVRKVTKNLEVMGSLGAFVPGDLRQSLLEAGGVKLGTTICYESIFPQLWRAQHKAGAQLFVNITNDAWFFQTAAPYQHLAVNVLRAVENGLPVLRAANTGFSAYIDARGVIRAQSGLFTQEILTVSVPLSVRQKETFYAHWGDWFAWVCALLFFTIGISTIVFFYEEY
jgi:apolipoprotein N-acyltransferase